MAYTKIFPIRTRLDRRVRYALNGKKTALEAAAGYTLDAAKTESVLFTDAFNCGLAASCAEMYATKRRWGKDQNRVQGYHIIQSFRPGEVTPEQAHEIGCEFIRRFLAGRYETVIGTHLDKAHPHNHIVFNACSYADGRMFRNDFNNYYNGIRISKSALTEKRYGSRPTEESYLMQAFQELYYIADQKYGGPLPVHVQCIQDEWANTPQPDNYLQILRTARSRNIGCSVVVQGLSAIKAMYKESWEEVVGNCDSFLFLGGNDQESLSYISKMTGKATIDTITRGETKGRGGSSSRNFQNTGRELVTPEELRMVDRDALLLIRGECPVLDRKYDLNRHPNIRYTEMGGAPPYKVPEDYCVLSAGISAEDVQEEWKKGTPLAPELLSAFEVLHSKEELEEKRIERKKEQA